jgi:hypothetical protein
LSARRKTDVRIGNRYGRLVVVDSRRRPRNNGYADAQSYCRCDCGKLTWISDTRLRRGERKECRSCTTKRAWQNIPRLSPDEITLRVREKHYRTDAQRKKRGWHLSREVFRKLILQPCVYCGIQSAGGIDRRDNTQGYTEQNSEPCCAKCNYAKRGQTVDEFLNWARRVFQHRKHDL